VDDVRGEEAFDVLTTVASRRPGNLIGVHAAQGEDALDHIRSLLELGRDATEGRLSALLARAVHVLVEVEIGDDGRRRVVRISEVTGADGANVDREDLFVWDGDFSAAGQASFA